MRGTRQSVLNPSVRCMSAASVVELGYSSEYRDARSLRWRQLGHFMSESSADILQEKAEERVGPRLNDLALKWGTNVEGIFSKEKESQLRTHA